MRIGFLACLIALACCGAADHPPTPATQPVKRSTTVEGLTFTLWVPPEIEWYTPLKAQLRNDSNHPIALLRMRAVPEGAPEWFKQFSVFLREATGKPTILTSKLPVPKPRLKLVLGPGEQIPQTIRLDLLCPTPPPGAYAMTVNMIVAQGGGDEVSLHLKDIPVTIAPPTAPQSVVRSTTVEGITFSVVVPPTVSVNTPITTYLRNEGKEPISFQTNSEVPNLFRIRVWDATGRHVGGPGRMSMMLHTAMQEMILRPGEQATQIMRLDQECLSLEPGPHSMTVGLYVTQGKDNRLLEVKDVPLQIIRK